jgi:hypothetical protein
VTDREPGKRIRYARVTPGHQAGTVTVTIGAAGHRSEVEVTYQLTALTDVAEESSANSPPITRPICTPGRRRSPPPC